MKNKTTVLQGSKFLLLSGGGWIIDFCTYITLTSLFSIDVGISNFISAIPAVTFVFLTSTRFVFTNHISKWTLKKKYVFYLIYQLILVACVSLIAQHLYDFITTSSFDLNTLVESYLKILIKLAITPITLIINFLVMKYLTEKI